MKRIKLTQEKYALVDDENFEVMNRYTWFYSKHGRTGYAYRIKIVSKNKSSKKPRKRINIKMHQDILCTKSGIDHIDHNGLNNCKNNLRICTQQQNCFNAQKTNKPTSSKFKGVTFDKQTNKWIAQITHNGNYIKLGRHVNEIIAAETYDKAAKKLFGEFAYTNF